jgi:flagellar basal-body rod modification protein FlgD
MSTINQTSSATSATGTTSATTTGSTAGSTTMPGGLGKNDFLKLLVGQLQHQDPMNPSGGPDAIAQMAQFSMVEQLTNLAGSTDQMLAQARRSSAMALIGRSVTYPTADGTMVNGTVEHVSVLNGNVTLTVGGVDGIDPAGVQEVG